MSIRRAIHTDAAGIARLTNECFADESEYIEADPETESSVASATNEHGFYLVAIESGELVGCVYVDLERRTIFKLAVDPSRRLNGIGRHLMAAAEEHGRGAGWPTFTIGVLNFKTYLFEVYGRLGYTATQRRGCVRALVRRPCHIVVMTKPVA